MSAFKREELLRQWKMCKEEDKKFESGEYSGFGTIAWEREQIIIGRMKAAGIWPPPREGKPKIQEKVDRGLRFRIFQRDSFTCVYCGRGSPDVTLEPDHVTPKSKGGKASLENLVTACFDCNRGKRDRVIRR